MGVGSQVTGTDVKVRGQLIADMRQGQNSPMQEQTGRLWGPLTQGPAGGPPVHISGQLRFGVEA